MDDLNKLEEELKKEGAGDDAKVLSLLGKNISNSLNFERSKSVKLDFLRQLNLYPKETGFFRIRAFASVLAVALFFVVVTVASAQASLPGQPLYPVKILSEKVAVIIRPSIKEEILTRRSEEIKSISGKRPVDDLKSAVSDYELELNKSRTLPSDKIEENKNNLEDAIKNSSGEDAHILEEAINKTEEKHIEIKSGEDVKGESSSSLNRE